MLRSLAYSFVFVLLVAIGSHAQTRASGEEALVPAADSQVATPPSPAQAPVQAVTESSDGLPRVWEQAISTKLEAMELSWKTLDRAIMVAQWVGIVVAGAIAVLAVFGFKSLRDISADAKAAARVAVDESFREKSGLASDLVTEANKINAILNQLSQLEGRLSGYAALADAAEAATKFDPLIEYRIIAPEIERRRAASIKLRRGDASIRPEDTLRDEEFSKKVAVVFSRLLETAHNDQAAGRQRLSTVDLYNLAASASEADLDFVSLEFMEIAAKVDRSSQPEVEARLIRQRLAASRITRGEARAAIMAVLARVNGFDLHHVVSEAFNIALMTADPGGMSKLIEESLEERLRNISYVQFARARLLMMSDLQADWEAVDPLVTGGLSALGRESVEARWYESAQDQLIKLMREQNRRSPQPAWMQEAVTSIKRFHGLGDDG